MSEETKPVEQAAPVAESLPTSAPVAPTAPPVKTKAQLDLEKKQAELKAQREARIKAANDLKAKRDDLKKNIGETFTDGERDGKVVGFEPDKMLGSVQGDAFLVNFGNPCRNDYHFCETFLATFKLKE